jgi:hypothetical protein
MNPNPHRGTICQKVTAATANHPRRNPQVGRWSNDRWQLRNRTSSTTSGSLLKSADFHLHSSSIIISINGNS